MRKLELRHNNAYDTQGNVADMITMIDCTNYRSLIGGDSEIESNAREWVGYGFFADAEKWWDAGCFGASCAAELRDAGIDADQVSGDCDLLDGFSWGYAHSNGDVSTEQVIASVKNN